MKPSIVEVQKKLPVFVFDIADRQELLLHAERAIQEEYEKDPRPRQSNVSAHFVSSYLGHRQNPGFAPLIELALDCVGGAVRATYGTPTKFQCVNCWGALYRAGDSARWHHHFPFDFAAVCYLQVDAGAAPIVFEEHLELHPAPGSLIVFSGLLVHHVPPTNGNRTVVGMNINRIDAPGA